MSIPIPTATNPGPVPNDIGQVRIDYIVGIVVGILAALIFISLGSGWWLLKRRQLSKAGMTRLPGEATIVPYPLPGEIEVDEKRPRFWSKRETMISVASDQFSNAEWGEGRSTSVQNGRDHIAQVTMPPRAVHYDVVIHGEPRTTEARRVDAFYHTDSGRRLAVERSSQTSLLEDPPSYSEAGQNIHRCT
ncbi:hypothetical protein PQX77_017067 [Marasmius sp. AFHP31]|nr:hypothetical protein PQX77_017067 [Marasmius sp. AFHP31]